MKHIAVMNRRPSVRSRIILAIVKVFMKRHFPDRGDINTVRNRLHSFKYPSTNYLLKRFPEVRIDQIELGQRKVPCEKVSDRRYDNPPVIVYFHGGAYVMGSTLTHRIIAVRLARRCRTQVVNVDYRLAPEHPFPAAIEDCLDVYQAVIANFDGPVFFGGDSAGGGLVIAALLAARDRGIKLPAGAFCFSPWLDLTMSGSSIADNKHLDAIVGNSPMNLYARAYAGAADQRHPWISPLFADLCGLPPILVQASSTEVLYSDAVRFSERAFECGVDVRLQSFKGQVHVFQAIPYVLPEADLAFSLLEDFVHGIVGT